MAGASWWAEPLRIITPRVCASCGRYISDGECRIMKKSKDKNSGNMDNTTGTESRSVKKNEDRKEREAGTCACGCGEDHGTVELAMILAEMPPEEEIYDLAGFFKIFADSTRIRILFALMSRDYAVNDLAAELSMTQSAVSHQLKILRQSKLVSARREGKSMIYFPADDHVRTIIAMGIDHIRE